MDEFVNRMLVAFANNFTFYLKSHNYHWIITGPDFPQYHEFLNKVYDDAQDSIDDYAEKIRQLGAFPQGNYTAIVSESELEDPVENTVDPVAIFTNLSQDLDTIITSLQDTYDLAGTVREYGIQNFLADRIDTHRQQQWMIHSILGQTP